ncbi:hypothetical protein PIROE2DRAFT_3275 [Piromyces sp. E2]|nr:hypothetical protein PIROE2DRAFT_3275 [Piromyces sp. E2]|eukprot:OUM68895.1 hypothetical protein PIROE2DRAFT_3275 [Piromyces sp. E2]
MHLAEIYDVLDANKDNKVYCEVRSEIPFEVKFELYNRLKSLSEEIYDILLNYYLSEDGFNFFKNDLGKDKSKYILEFSNYPVLIIISSDKNAKNKIPSYDIIKSLISNMVIHINYLKTNKYYKNCYCIPHTIGCSLSSTLNTKKIKCYTNFNCLSFEDKYTMPIFVTSDTMSNGYIISLNSSELIMMDGFTISKNSMKIAVPYYKFNLNIQNKLKFYAFYLGKKNLKTIEDISFMIIFLRFKYKT